MSAGTEFEAARQEVRRIAGASDTADVFFYTAKDLLGGNALSVPSASIKKLLKTRNGLVLAELRRGDTGHATVTSVYPLTAEFCESPLGRTAVVFLYSRGAYDVNMTKLPRYVSVPTLDQASNTGTTCEDCSCRESVDCPGSYLDHITLLAPQNVRETVLNENWMGAPLDILVDTLLLYAHEMLDVLEQRIYNNTHRVDSPQTLRTLSTLHDKHYWPLWKQHGGTELRRHAAMLMLMLCARPREAETASKAATKRGELRAAFDEVVTRAGNAACPWSAALFAAEDMHLQHLLGDTESGVHRCIHCVMRLLSGIHLDVLPDALSETPWIESILGSPPVIAVRIPGPTPLFAMTRALAWRLPTMAEYRENAADLTPLVELPALLYGAVTHVMRRLHLDTLHAAFAIYSDLPKESREALARIQDHSSVRALCDAWDQHAAQLESSSAAIIACRASTPCPTNLSTERTAAVAPTTLRQSGGNTAEEAHAWHDALHARSTTIATRVTDIEDLLENDLLPPCLSCTLSATRSSAHADNVERRTLGLWARDMGVPVDSVSRLVLGVNATTENAREMTMQAEYAARLGADKTSLDCSALMNPMNNKMHGASLGCPMRAQYLGTADSGGKITDTSVLGAIRWRCTRTLKGFVHGVHPRFAVRHPVDYITLQLDARDALVPKPQAAHDVA